MADVLGAGADHFRAQEASRLDIGIDAQHAAVAQHDPRTALVAKIDFACHEGIAFQPRERRAHQRDLRIGEHHAQCRPAHARRDLRIARGVLAGDAPFIGRFVQQGRVGVGVAGDEHRRLARLHGVAVEMRHAARIERQAGVVQIEPIDIGTPAGRHQSVVEALGALGIVQRHVTHFDLVADALGFQHTRVRIQVELLLEGLAGALAHARVGDAAQAAAHAEHAHLHAQARQRLAQFQPDHAGPEHRHARRQRVPGEYVVVDHQAVAQGQERRGHRGPRAAGDDHAAGAHLGMPVHAQHRVLDKARHAAQLVLGRDVLHSLQHETDEAVALGLDTRHHLRAVDPHRAIDVHTEGAAVARRMGRLGGRDQQLGRHAAHARASRAVLAAFDQQGALAGGARGAIGRQAGRAGTYDGHVSMQGFHRLSS